MHLSLLESLTTGKHVTLTPLPPILVPSHSSGQTPFPPPLAKPPRCPSTTPSPSTTPPLPHICGLHLTPAHTRPSSHPTPRPGCQPHPGPPASPSASSPHPRPGDSLTSAPSTPHPPLPRCHTQVSACLGASALFADVCGMNDPMQAVKSFSDQCNTQWVLKSIGSLPQESAHLPGVSTAPRKGEKR